MNSVYTKKLIVSSMLLTLVLGGGSLYTVRHSALAKTSEAYQAQTIADKQQSDSNSANILSQVQERGNQIHRAGKGFPLLDESASILGTDRQSLEKSLKANKSIVDVAKEKGISEADLTSKLLMLRKGKIEEAVKNGKLDAVRADRIKQHMEEHLKFMLNQKGLPTRNEHHFKERSLGFHADFANVAQSLGLTEEELKTELKSGKSLTEVAAAKGVSKGKLMDTIKSQLTPSIEEVLDHKKTATP
jgi:hypothetical protein